MPTLTTAYFGNVEANAILTNRLQNRKCWLALHTAEPGPLFDPSTELDGLGYERQPISFGAPAAQAIVNDNNGTFTALPASELTWLSVHAVAVGADQLIFVVQLDDPQTIPHGQDFLFAAGDIGISL